MDFEVEVVRILPGGMGLAHANGKTVFVSLAAPGDRVRVRVEREQGNVLFASIVEIMTPGPSRIEPWWTAPWSAERCPPGFRASRRHDRRVCSCRRDRIPTYARLAGDVPAAGHRPAALRPRAARSRSQPGPPGRANDARITLSSCDRRTSGP